MIAMLGFLETFDAQNTSGVMPTIAATVGWLSQLEQLSAHCLGLIVIGKIFQDSLWSFT